MDDNGGLPEDFLSFSESLSFDFGSWSPPDSLDVDEPIAGEAFTRRDLPDSWRDFLGLDRGGGDKPTPDDPPPPEDPPTPETPDFREVVREFLRGGWNDIPEHPFAGFAV